MRAHIDEAVYGVRKRRTFWEVLTSEKYYRWLLISPLLLTLAVFMFYPLFYCLYYSTAEYSLAKAPVFIGWENYRYVLGSALFWTALGRTFKVLVISIAVELSLGLTLALLWNRKFTGENVTRGLCLLPLLISPLAMSLMWNYITQYDYGVINLVLLGLHLGKVQWFDVRWALYTITFMSIWQWTPFSIFVFLAGLRGLPRDAFEAAKVDGASAWYTFRRLTLPMLTPLILIIVLLRTMWLIRLFDPLYGTTRGGVGTESLDWFMYRISFVFFDVGKGSALALFSLYVTIVLCAILYRQLIKALGAAR
ncbi:MAG: sugar ABC transporter permease [Desulfobacteraceae bacterium]|nr:sugar ABC transporter permease [Desulfobacteraceae bacterium]